MLRGEFVLNFSNFTSAATFSSSAGVRLAPPTGVPAEKESCRLVREHILLPNYDSDSKSCSATAERFDLRVSGDAVTQVSCVNAHAAPPRDLVLFIQILHDPIRFNLVMYPLAPHIDHIIFLFCLIG